jgi:hypothetical protein
MVPIRLRLGLGIIANLYGLPGDRHKYTGRICFFLGVQIIGASVFALAKTDKK